MPGITLGTSFVGSTRVGSVPSGPGGIATTNVKLWLKTDALGLSNGTAISSFTDSGPLAQHAVQATGSKQPVYTTGGQNGKPYALFDSTDDVLRCAALTITDTAAIMVILVFASPVTGDDGIIYEMTDADAGSTAGCIQGYRRGDDFFRLQLRGNGGASAPQLLMADVALSSTPTYTTTTYDFSQAAGSEISFRRNGVDRTAFGTVVNGATNNTDAAFANQPLNIGNRGGAGGLACGIRLYEFIILKGTNTTERNTVESYLASKYGL